MRCRPVVLAVLAVALTPASAQACSCVPIDDEQQMAKADAAFIGRLVSVRPIGSSEPSPGARARFRYRVLRDFKDRLGDYVVVRSALSSSICGLPTGRGRRYALYIDRHKRRWHGGLCSMTTPRRMREAASSGISASGAVRSRC